MADEDKTERRDSASSHSSDSSLENGDDNEKAPSSKSGDSDKHSSSSEHEDDPVTSEHEHDETETDKHSTSSDHEEDHSSSEHEHDGNGSDKLSTSSEHATDKLSSTSSGEDNPEKVEDHSPSGSPRSSKSSASLSPHSDKHSTDDSHSQTTDENHSHSGDEPPMALPVDHEGFPPDDLNDDSIDSFGISHVYANAAFEPGLRADYQDTSGAESPSTRRASLSTSTDYERPNPPPSDLGFYTIPLQETESDRPPSSSTVVVNPDEEKGWLTYLYGAIAFSLIFILILILYFAIGFSQ